VSDHLRSIVVLYLNGGSPDRLIAIGNAAIKALQVRNNVIFPQNGEGAIVTALDGVVAAPAPPSLRSRLDVPIRIGLGLVLGVVLAFLAWYFDPRIRDRADADAIGLDIIAEIPKK
jgi:capsular polysaccharide biosynthesis protein